MIIGVVIDLFLIFLSMIVDHILKLSILIIESSQILVNSFMVDQPIHQVIGILWQFLHFQDYSHHFLYGEGKIALVKVPFYVLNKRRVT